MLLPFALCLALQATANPAISLAEVRSALSIVDAPPWPETLGQGKATIDGLEGDYTLRLGSKGRYVRSVSGPLGEMDGYDGRRYWQRDRTGAPSVLSFVDADAELGLHLLMTDRWVAQDFRGTVTVDGAKIVVTPKGSGVVDVIEIDPNTHLPLSAVIRTLADEHAVTLSDWRPAGAFKLPFNVVLNNEGVEDRYRLSTASSAETSPEEAFGSGDPKPGNVSYDAAKPAAVECKRAISGHLLVHPTVDGKDAGWFILDSGAGCMVIDAKVADGIKLPNVGKGVLVGVGGKAFSPYRTVDEFDLGPVKMGSTEFAEVDLSELSSYFKVKIAGVVGADFFRRCIIDVALATPSVSIYDPSAFSLSGGKWVPLLFDSGNPTVPASMEGDRKGWFRLDTGADGTVVFHGPYVKQQHLLDRPDLANRELDGVGGFTKAKQGHIAWFELGGHRFENPEVMFALSDTGPFGDGYLAGNIGQDFMTPFHIVFDYPDSRIAFVPLAATDKK